MIIETQSGSPSFPVPATSTPCSTIDAIESAIERLQSRKEAWVRLPVRERMEIIDRLIRDCVAVAPRWVSACNQAQGVAAGSVFGGENWISGPYTVLRSLRGLRRALQDIEDHQKPAIPGKVTTRHGGQVVAEVFPQTLYDRIFFAGITIEVWMEPGVTKDDLPNTMALSYQGKDHEGKVALILGTGNVSGATPTEILYKLFVEDQVVLVKMNPINDYLGPLVAESFRALVEPGFLRLVYGGVEEGGFLCRHPGVEEIHLTGSDKTFHAIVFGSGPEGLRRKSERKPALTKRVTAELGNVSPVIIVPGPWGPADIAYHAEQLATSLTNNGGFNCDATRVILQHSGWDQRHDLLGKIRYFLGTIPLRDAYYPGAAERHRAFVSAHPEAEVFGTPTGTHLPWTLIAGVNPMNEDDICFNTEAFCGVFCETGLEAKNVAEYIDRAVQFSNERLWGTLNATLIVHPASLRDPAVAAAMERAIANLRYGTIGINYWAASAYVAGLSPWGSFPGGDIYDVQSGIGFVHNPLMFSRPEKTVVRAPFRIRPKPVWFTTRGAATPKVFQKLVDLEASPALWKIPGVLWSALG